MPQSTPTSASAPMIAIIRAAIIAVTIALFFASSFNAIAGNRDLSVVLALATPLGISAWGFARAGHHEEAVVFLSCVLVTVATLSLVLNPHGVRDVALTAYAAIVLIDALLLSRRAYVAVAGVSAFAAACVFILEINGYTAFRAGERTDWRQLVVFLGLLGAFATVGRLAAEALLGSLGAARLASIGDPVTGLANRIAFLTQAPAGLAAQKGKPGCGVLVLADLDGFRRVNLVIGHRAADGILREAARRVTAAAGTHVVARVGDDEFAVLALGLADEAAAAAFARSIHAALDFDFSGVSVRNAAGFARFPRDAHGIEPLLLAAESALVEAKRQNDDRFAGPADRI
jgi:diguanylate cyclase (GGDEF)-like protein